MPKLRFLRTGLYLGDVKKNRFEPSQALAMALKPEEFVSCIRLEPEDVRTVKYLKGETLDVSDSAGGKAEGMAAYMCQGLSSGIRQAGRRNPEK